MTISERMEQAMAQVDLNQYEVAKLMGVSQPCINYWLKGKREPKYADLLKFCEITHTTPNFIFGFDDLRSGNIPQNDLIEMCKIIALWLNKKGKKQDIAAILKLAYAVYDEVKMQPHEEWECKIYSICDILERVRAA